MIKNIDKNYIEIFSILKEKIKRAQIKTMVAVNSELITLYWEIGKTILEQQKKQGWGSNIINQLSKDLKKSFPKMKGFSPRNLSYMKKLAHTYPDFKFLQQVVAKLPWGQNIILLDKINSDIKRLWYAKKSIQNGWSRNVLVHQIESKLYERQKTSKDKTTNFLTVLPSPNSELAQDMIKDPYKFDFLQISEEAKEREIEESLVKHIKDFLLELGSGFAFVGQQYHLEIGGQDFYIDLLFYNINLKCYVVIELKAGDFKPSDVGQLNFYLSAVDNLLQNRDGNPTIGLLLCKTKNKTIAEYSLRDMSKPMGISEYKLTEAIPENLKTSLPTIEELESELANIEENKLK